MAKSKGGTAGTDQSNPNARSRRPDRLSTVINRQTDAALRFAGTSTGKSILAGVFATVAGLLLSRDRRVREAAVSAGNTIREGATDAAGRVREAASDARDTIRNRIAERGNGYEAGDELAEPFEVPTTARTDNTVIAH